MTQMPHVLISGGSRGIGRSAADLFAANGWSVTCLFHKNKPEVKDNIIAIQCDVKDPAQVKESVRLSEEKPVWQSHLSSSQQSEYKRRVHSERCTFGKWRDRTGAYSGIL